ncbi:MAG: acetylxylan esterase, partial [Armatimonadetes bacterium]|nr:acetylxylan esterase [Armatimonadota bacterium]
FHRSARPDLPAEAAGHVVHGIAARESYLHRYCVADLWSAGSALATLFPPLGGRYRYSGASFGGGIGAMALPWDPRLERAHLVVPSFGHHPLRLTMPCVGSGEAVRNHYAAHPEVAAVLAFHDAAIHATRTTIPVFCVAALFDPAVPPPGQFAVHNALAGEKELFVLSAGHFNYPRELSEGLEHRRRLAAWFAA